MNNDSLVPIEERDKPEDTNTIEATIEANKDNPIAYSSLSIVDILDNGEDKIKIPSENALYMYIDELKNASFKVKLSDADMITYKYRPDLLSYRLYGTIEYEYVLLAINDMISPKYFTKNVVSIIDAEYIQELVSMIADAEDEYIQKNRSQVDNNSDSTFI